MTFLSDSRHKGNCGATRLLRARRGVSVAKKPDKQIEEIEETQEALRESIDEAKQLAEKAQELLQKHKETIKRQAQ